MGAGTDASPGPVQGLAGGDSQRRRPTRRGMHVPIERCAVARPSVTADRWRPPPTQPADPKPLPRAVSTCRANRGLLERGRQLAHGAAGDFSDQERAAYLLTDAHGVLSISWFGRPTDSPERDCSMTIEPQTRDRILDAAKRSLLNRGLAASPHAASPMPQGYPSARSTTTSGPSKISCWRCSRRRTGSSSSARPTVLATSCPCGSGGSRRANFLEDDLDSGYVRVLHEMAAVGWSNEQVAAAVRKDLVGWYDLLAAVANGVGAVRRARPVSRPARWRCSPLHPSSELRR